jgi:hypothetical protein
MGLVLSIVVSKASQLSAPSHYPAKKHHSDVFFRCDFDLYSASFARPLQDSLGSAFIDEYCASEEWKELCV